MKIAEQLVEAKIILNNILREQLEKGHKARVELEISQSKIRSINLMIWKNNKLITQNFKL
ncbi:MAG: hypothetical protein GF313_09395 [Caldithrix sp.]|nr:hypothetical protein [Caldithrix sp.]